MVLQQHIYPYRKYTCLCAVYNLIIGYHAKFSEHNYLPRIQRGCHAQKPLLFFKTETRVPKWTKLSVLIDRRWAKQAMIPARKKRRRKEERNNVLALATDHAMRLSSRPLYRSVSFLPFPPAVPGGGQPSYIDHDMYTFF
jgi:hypothetical protein